MKYELNSKIYGAEITIDKESYSKEITLVIRPTDGVAPDFQKTVTMVFSNKQTGFETDAQEEKEIQEYMDKINSTK